MPSGRTSCGTHVAYCVFISHAVQFVPCRSGREVQFGPRRPDEIAMGTLPTTLPNVTNEDFLHNGAGDLLTRLQPCSLRQDEPATASNS